jgi:hypothetical protein
MGREPTDSARPAGDRRTALLPSYAWSASNQSNVRVTAFFQYW